MLIIHLSIGSLIYSSIQLSIYSSTYIFIYQFISLFIYTCVDPLTHSLIYPSSEPFYVSVELRITPYLFGCSFIDLSICCLICHALVCVCVYLSFVYPSICASIRSSGSFSVCILIYVCVFFFSTSFERVWVELLVNVYIDARMLLSIFAFRLLIYPFIYLSIELCINLFTFWSICLSIDV